MDMTRGRVCISKVLFSVAYFPMQLRQVAAFHHALRSGFHSAASLAAARAGVYSFLIHTCLFRRAVSVSHSTAVTKLANAGKR